MRETFSGIEQADSITFDAHKWLSVPMGAGMFFTRHPDMAERAFSIAAGYMPRATDGAEIIEPHRSSMQWTRRFIGLKLFLSLLVAGWEGYEQTIREMVRLGGVLRERLEAAGFELVNQTPLPVACFQDASHPEGRELSYLKAMAETVVSSGKTWISVTSLGDTTPALRACITNFRNREEDIDALIDLLKDARDHAS
jgi:glutamate/tyrosine decarboxylase-like PLP-dependent enzyme